MSEREFKIINKQKNLIIVLFVRIIHKQVGRLEALQLADAQSTGLGLRGRSRKLPLDGAVSL